MKCSRPLFGVSLFLHWNKLPSICSEMFSSPFRGLFISTNIYSLLDLFRYIFVPFSWGLDFYKKQVFTSYSWGACFRPLLGVSLLLHKDGGKCTCPAGCSSPFRGLTISTHYRHWYNYNSKWFSSPSRGLSISTNPNSLKGMVKVSSRPLLGVSLFLLYPRAMMVYKNGVLVPFSGSLYFYRLGIQEALKDICSRPLLGVSLFLLKKPKASGTTWLVLVPFSGSLYFYGMTVTIAI